MSGRTTAKKAGRGFHIVTAVEVGPNIFDLKCGSCRWQSFTWHGQAHALELADRHRLAVRIAQTETGRRMMAQSKDLIGYVGQDLVRI